MARDSQGSSNHLKVVGEAYGKRKDLIYEEQIHHRRYDRKCNLYTHSGGHAGHLSGSKKHECQCPLFPRNSLWILL